MRFRFISILDAALGAVPAAAPVVVAPVVVADGFC
jgi:hypothetical protein